MRTEGRDVAPPLNIPLFLQSWSVPPLTWGVGDGKVDDGSVVAMLVGEEERSITLRELRKLVGDPGHPAALVGGFHKPLRGR